MTRATLAAALGAKQPERFAKECDRSEWWWLLKHRLTMLLPRCQFCGRWGHTVKHGSMTLYASEPTKYRACVECAEADREYWTDRWQDYYDSIR